MEQNIQTYIEKLEKRCASTDPSKRIKCVQDLRKRMETSEECIVKGLEFLIRLLHDPEPWVRKESLMALEDINRTVITSLPSSPDGEFKVHYQGKMVPAGKLLQYQIIQLTADPETIIRKEAMRIVGERWLEIPSIREKAVPFLMARMRDPDTDVRNAAIRHILKITRDDLALIRPYLLKLYGEKKRSTDVYVTYILDKLMDDHPMTEFVPLFLAKLGDSDVNTTRFLVSALVRCGIHDLEPHRTALIRGLTDRTAMLWWVDARNMMLILRGVAAERPEAVRPYLRYLIPLLREENREVRKLATETVGTMGRGDPDRVREAIADLVRLTADPDDLVKEAARSSLRSIGIPDRDLEIAGKASRSLNEAKILLAELKTQDDLTGMIRDSYTAARKTFSDRRYEDAMHHADMALAGARVRTRLRGHASESIRSVERILERVRGEASEEPSFTPLAYGITARLGKARQAFVDRKYFLAGELISSRKINLTAPGTSPGTSGGGNDLLDLAPHMERTLDTIVCPVCGEGISRGDTACSSCGHRMNSTFCPECGSSVLQGFLFCPDCGGRLDLVCETCGTINESTSSVCIMCGNGLTLIHETGNDTDPLGPELDIELIPRR